MRTFSESLKRLRTPAVLRRTLPILVATVAIAPGCGDQRAHPSAPQRVTIDLQPLNGSGVKGTANLDLVGDKLMVDISARGLEPNRIHGQAIHGFKGSGRMSACDFSGAGVVDAKTGDRVYGPTVLSLQPFPTVGSDGQLHYRLTFTVHRGDVAPLGSRAIVMQGMTPHGQNAVYQPGLPVACGKVRGGTV